VPSAVVVVALKDRNLPIATPHQQKQALSSRIRNIIKSSNSFYSNFIGNNFEKCHVEVYGG
jgi:alpha-acetolactate decarboxylase